MVNYIKFRTRSPFTCSYMFIDCRDFLADQLFIKHKIPVKSGKELERSDSQYIIICCDIKKKYEKEFLVALSELRNRMLLLGYDDYDEYCESVLRSRAGILGYL